ncbi:MAG: AAA family ATPase [Clostridia bacterium]|nr:AAA family ATPase [Clostridia bacterium]
MIYLRSFDLASELAETEFFLSFPYQLEMLCYDRENAYPFHIFPPKYLSRLEFAPVTIFYGGNGSGKSTLLNVIAQKLGVFRASPFNVTPLFGDYLSLCSFEAAEMPEGNRIITSDDVFDFLLDLRAINRGVEKRREELFAEYEGYKDPNFHFQMRSMAEYDELKIRNEARKKTKSAFVSSRLNVREVHAKSNGESAFLYFTEHIKENALYLLDEPENSLSPKLQRELAAFLSDSARFFGCQFIISTHSPFLLSLNGAKIYDLDAVPAEERKWTELENVKIYHDFFEEHKKEFL